MKDVELFLRDDELLRAAGRHLSGVQLLLRLTAWKHPDISGGETPSQNPCFQSLARAVAANDATAYSCPEAEYNTHWSNWTWVENL
jgi:hypothetical protein